MISAEHLLCAKWHDIFYIFYLFKNLIKAYGGSYELCFPKEKLTLSADTVYKAIDWGGFQTMACRNSPSITFHLKNEFEGLKISMWYHNQVGNTVCLYTCVCNIVIKYDQFFTSKFCYWVLSFKKYYKS